MSGQDVYVLYTAVLPAYRRYCMELLREELGGSLKVFAGPRHLDASVRTDIPTDWYECVKNVPLLGGRLLFQWGGWKSALRADSTILDLNPRSVTAWFLLISRKILGRRTLVWGHLDPRRGPSARTAAVRSAMRRLADGCIVYTYTSAERLQGAAPREKVWVAPNSLYPEAFLGVVGGDHERTRVLYVGRLEPEKKPVLLLHAFKVVAAQSDRWKLVIVGDGTLRSQLQDLAARLGIATRVEFRGAVTDPVELSELYAEAWCSVSPGFVGLTLTQSLGFGVPMVIADNEPHSPEIELAQPGAVLFFKSDSVEALADALVSSSHALSTEQRFGLVDRVRRQYSTETMTRGLVDSFRDKPQMLDRTWVVQAIGRAT